MSDAAKKKLYRKVWLRVRKEYLKGYVVTERNLQAILHKVLQEEFSGVHVIVEPTWHTRGGNFIHDLVIVDGKEITDIFEIKFKPQWKLNWRPDIEKLLFYRTNHRGQYPVHLDPKTGKWDLKLPLRRGCRLHFVAIARYNAKAVSSEVIKKPRINRWYGRTGDGGGAGEWDIRFATE